MKQPLPPGFCCDGGGEFELKTAVQVRLALIRTLPPQPPPLQPAKFEPLSGVGVSETFEFSGNCAWHEVPQLIPGELERTVPMPEPALRMVSVRMPPTSTTELPVSRVT